jgi:TrkA domain protein
VPKIKETSLPGVGVRHDFTAEDGSRIGVVHHRTGRRELFFCEPDDPDAVSHSLNLSDEDSHASPRLSGALLSSRTWTDCSSSKVSPSIGWK